MMKRYLLAALTAVIACTNGHGQSMHFSQYYNAPLLLNPANTALMPDLDYRLGANYRNQWSALPVPFNTICAYGDMKIGGGDEGRKWLGLGGAIFNDKAGSGDLSLLQMQLSVAYHLHVSSNGMLSLGLQGGYSQRSVNYDKLTFDNQWDGVAFNTHISTGEKIGILKTNFYNVAAGINYAYLTEALYVKVGAGLANINQPTETFYNKTNQLAMRPTLNLDVLFRTGERTIFNPSVYYTTQSGASELVFGTLTRLHLSSPNELNPSQLILGAYYRMADAVIGVVGYQYGTLQITANYDMTASTLAPYNGSYGAMEISLVWGGNYYKNKGARKMYACPRF